MKPCSLILSLVAAGVCLTSNIANADTCGSLTLDADAQDVVLGEYGAINYTYGLGEWIAPSFTLGVCWRDVGGAWHVEKVDGCDSSTPAGDVFLLQTSDGDDYVAPLMEEQTYDWISQDAVYAGKDNWGINTYGLSCEGGFAVAPWHDGFSFGVHAVMGKGADEFHGTPNDDVAESYFTSIEWERSPPPFGPRVPVYYAPGDESLDMLCGGDGNDELFGDADDDWQSGFEELLDGGNGNDFCDGDPPTGPFGAFTSGGSVSDVATSGCNTFERAANMDTWFSCEDSSNPIEFLDL